MNDKVTFEKIIKRDVVPYFKVGLLSHHSSEDTEESHRNVKLSNLRTDLSSFRLFRFELGLRNTATLYLVE